MPTTLNIVLLAGLVALMVSAEKFGSSIQRSGCARVGHCCQGKNNTCKEVVSVDAPSRDKEVDKNEIPGKSFKECFCDSACLDLGDCCSDYKDVCAPVDCVVTEKWSDWSDCDSRCGPGTRQRTKGVIQPALNGGRPCPPNLEKAVCEGTSCKIARAPEGFEELRETAKIIQASYGTWRKSKLYDPYSDIRRNLFEQNHKDKAEATRPSYCVKFELTEVRPPCLKSDFAGDLQWSRNLTKGSTVCVECQPTAMKDKLGGRCRGHGVYLKETRWDAVAIGGCRGKWILTTRQEECQCSPDAESSFILI